MNLSKKFWIIGGTGGIGSAVVSQLRDQGHTVFVSARKNSDYPLDVLNPDSITNALKAIESEGVNLDGVALCVGSVMLRPLHLLSDADFQDTLNLNLIAAFYVARAATQHFLKQSDVSLTRSVVLCSSTAALIGLNNHEAIAAAKAGIDGLVRSAAATYAAKKIRFNSVAPGMTDTGLVVRLTSNPKSKEISEQLHPLNRIANPSEIAKTIVFLLNSEQSDFITGQTWAVDGGLSQVKNR